MPNCRRAIPVLLSLAVLLDPARAHAQGRSDSRGPANRLPTGVTLDPVGTMEDVGSLPLGMISSRDRRFFVLVNSGFGHEGIQIVNRGTGKVTQTIQQPSAFLGAAFSRNDSTLFVSGGDRDVIYKYAWDNSAGIATLQDSILLGMPDSTNKRYPAGLAMSISGKWLYVAENLADSLAVIDIATNKVTQRLGTERYPYDVRVAPDRRVYVSAWGGYTVSVFARDSVGLRSEGRIRVGRHPSALRLNTDGSRLFVASGSTDRVTVVDTRHRQVVATLFDPPPEGPGEGSTPNAMRLSADGTRLFVAEADANSIAVFNLSASTSNVATATGDDKLAGRIPTGWYPTALYVGERDTLFIVSGKGRGTAPNPRLPQPGAKHPPDGPDDQYTLAQIHGTLSIALHSNAQGNELRALTTRVAVANGWNTPTARRGSYPPFQHVVYIIKENRTYDQVFGDMPHADSDPSLLFFGRDVGPNHHALAERFGLFDRFFVNAEVSADGHNWTTAAYATDYVQKTVQANYSGRGRSYDFEGTNRDGGYGNVTDDDVNEPASGYLWNLAEQKGITFRNYGEFVVVGESDSLDAVKGKYHGTKPFLVPHTNPDYPPFDLDIRDQLRADVYIRELGEFSRLGTMPALEILHLPNDHTSGASGGKPTPRAYFADNDLALGRIVEALSTSPFWASTVVFVLEDDAQNGPDHVDSHRSPLLVISPYNRPGTIHRFANTTDVLRTIEEILGLSSLSQFDYFGRPLRDIWANRADLQPYRARTPLQSLGELNPEDTPEARGSEALDLDEVDAADEDTFNRILWATIRGRGVPYPGARRASALEFRR